MSECYQHLPSPSLSNFIGLQYILKNILVSNVCHTNIIYIYKFQQIMKYGLLITLQKNFDNLEKKGYLDMGHKIYQTITAEGTANLRKSMTSRKASLDRPIHVFLQVGENLMQIINNKTFIQ